MWSYQMIKRNELDTDHLWSVMCTGTIYKKDTLKKKKTRKKKEKDAYIYSSRRRQPLSEDKNTSNNQNCHLLRLCPPLVSSYYEGLMATINM